MMIATPIEEPTKGCDVKNLSTKIHDEKDIAKYKLSPGYKNLSTFIDLLCDHILGTGTKVFNGKYNPVNKSIKDCGKFMELLDKRCEETDLKIGQGPSSVRFGHVAFRDWFDEMKNLTKDFIAKELASENDDIYKEELYSYLIESFGNRMRIDYGTGHELNFIIFLMGLSNLLKTDESTNVRLKSSDPKTDLSMTITPEKLKSFVNNNGWDLIWLFCHKYLRLCRKVQKKFRLEPAGSRGVYNMDDYQYLPFLFGSAQLVGQKYIPTENFYDHVQVEDYKNDFIFFEAIDFILNNKRGPFNEHSYTLWNFSGIASWENIFRRMKSKFKDDVLHPFPIVQHLYFSAHIFSWN